MAVLKPCLEKCALAYWSTGSIAGAAQVAGRSRQWAMTHREELRQRLSELSEQALENLKARRGKIIAELETIAYGAIDDFLILDQAGKVIGMRLPADKRGALHSVQQTKDGIKVTMYDKIRALDLLARISGLQVDKVDITSGGRPLSAPLQVTFEVVPSRQVKEVKAEVVDAKS